MNIKIKNTYLGHIKPCPLCNNNSFEFNLLRQEDFKTYYIKCLECGYSTDELPDVEQVIDIWNKRIEETNMWEPETDACNECKECGYFLDDYWNCQGEPVPCFDFYPKPGSKLKKIEFIVEPENIPDKTEI